MSALVVFINVVIGSFADGVIGDRFSSRSSMVISMLNGIGSAANELEVFFKSLECSQNCKYCFRTWQKSVNNGVEFQVFHFQQQSLDIITQKRNILLITFFEGMIKFEITEAQEQNRQHWSENKLRRNLNPWVSKDDFLRVYLWVILAILSPYNLLCTLVTELSKAPKYSSLWDSNTALYASNLLVMT